MNVEHAPIGRAETKQCGVITVGAAQSLTTTPAATPLKKNDLIKDKQQYNFNYYDRT